MQPRGISTSAPRCGLGDRALPSSSAARAMLGLSTPLSNHFADSLGFLALSELARRGEATTRRTYSSHVIFRSILRRVRENGCSGSEPGALVNSTVISDQAAQHSEFHSAGNGFL